jgi:HD-GYP domain-containing protein (c-di-GMP phosphodiesterase class II)
VDVWDAIQSDRPYNKAWSREKSLQHMREEAGKYFDSAVVEMFLNMVEAGQI